MKSLHLSASGEQKLRTLLVEDNPVNAKIAMRLLQRHIFVAEPVIHAQNGQIAVEEWCKEPFDVILMDLQMPEMDGLTATRLIRQYEKERVDNLDKDPELANKPEILEKARTVYQTLYRTRIIALTANAMKGDEDDCLAAGMDFYLAKPIDPAKLQAVLMRIATEKQLVDKKTAETPEQTAQPATTAPAQPTTTDSPENPNKNIDKSIDKSIDNNIAGANVVNSTNAVNAANATNVTDDDEPTIDVQSFHEL